MCTGRLHAEVATATPLAHGIRHSPTQSRSVIEESRCDMLFGPVLVTYLVTALGGVSLCLLITVLTSRHRESL